MLSKQSDAEQGKCFVQGKLLVCGISAYEHIPGVSSCCIPHWPARALPVADECKRVTLVGAAHLSKQCDGTDGCHGEGVLALRVDRVFWGQCHGNVVTCSRQ